MLPNHGVAFEDGHALGAVECIERVLGGLRFNNIDVLVGEGLNLAFRRDEADYQFIKTGLLTPPIRIGNHGDVLTGFPTTFLEGVRAEGRRIFRGGQLARGGRIPVIPEFSGLLGGRKVLVLEGLEELLLGDTDLLGYHVRRKRTGNNQLPIRIRSGVGDGEGTVTRIALGAFRNTVRVGIRAGYVVEQRFIGACSGLAIHNPLRVLANPVHVGIFTGDGFAALVLSIIVESVLHGERVLGNHFIVTERGAMLPLAIGGVVAESGHHAINNKRVGRAVGSGRQAIVAQEFIGTDGNRSGPVDISFDLGGATLAVGGTTSHDQSKRGCSGHQGISGLLHEGTSSLTVSVPRGQSPGTE